MQIWPGKPYPLGATFDGVGTNFSVFSEVAERVELCLFDDDGQETRVDLPERTALCWHGYVPNVGPASATASASTGRGRPTRDSGATPRSCCSIPTRRRSRARGTGTRPSSPITSLIPRTRRNDLDSAPFVPKCVVINPFFDWGHDRRPNTPWHRTVVYETHVKGFTRTHPDIPEELRGTYAGMAHPVAVEYLKQLGVTAVELLPVHQFVHDSTLVESGLRNYWGYNSIGYLAPHNEYAARASAASRCRSSSTSSRPCTRRASK